MKAVTVPFLAAVCGLLLVPGAPARGDLIYLNLRAREGSDPAEFTTWGTPKVPPLCPHELFGEPLPLECPLGLGEPATSVRVGTSQEFGLPGEWHALGADLPPTGGVSFLGAFPPDTLFPLKADPRHSPPTVHAVPAGGPPHKSPDIPAEPSAGSEPSPFLLAAIGLLLGGFGLLAWDRWRWVIGLNP
jgi:hypothetical protein